MFKEFFTLEIKSALKQPMIYIFTFLIAILSFGAVASDNVVIGGAIGNIYKNAPFVITQFVITFSLLGILFVVAFCNNAALRDYNNQFQEILFSKPIKKSGYFFGRFFGALFLSTIPLIGIYIGVLVGSVIGPQAGWINEDQIGPFYLETFVNTYLLFILPNMFFGGTIIYALATKFKSTVISFVGALGIIIAYGVSGTLLSDLDNETLGALMDSFGFSTYDIYSKYFTPAEKNTLSPGFDGILLLNRLIWIAVGLVVLMISYFSFSFKEKKSSKKKKTESSDNESYINSTKSVRVAPSFSGKYWLGQTISLFKINFLNLIKSLVFRVIFLFALILLIVEFIGGFEYFGLQSYPVTYRVIDMIIDSSSLFLIIILIFFSGELVWKDRLSNIHEVINASPHLSASSVIAKVASLVSISAVLYFFFSLIGIAYQLIQGFSAIELDLYFSTYFLRLFPDYLFYSMFFIFLQIIINKRYLAYFISILLVFVWNITLGVMDIRSNMLDLMGTPSIQYSEMNGFGPGVESYLWFCLYWVLIGLILLFIGILFWARSEGASLKDRFKKASYNLNKPMKLALGSTLIIWLGVASFVYYNTQVLNTYKSSDETEFLAVRYEQKYKKYQGMTLPRVTAVTYQIDIFPKQRDVFTKSIITLKNKSEEAIDSLHLNLNGDWETKIDIPNAKLVMEDDSLDYQIYAFEKSLLPGDSIVVEVESNLITKGFENGRGNTSIIRNGTFLNNFAFTPSLGYNEGAELSDKNDRKKYKLPPKKRLPELDSSDYKLRDINYLTDGSADWVRMETFISTSADQIAVAPGRLVKEWQEDDRNHYHYKIDQPSQLFCSFVSADYQVAKRDWKGISLEVYYDEKHDYNIEMMLDAIQKSLEYYTENFGPYYHSEARIIEFPRYANFAQAFPGTMPYSESFGFIINLEDTTQNNVIDAVIAHEMAHQWWAHQVIGAKMQGGTMLSESFSEYSSLMVMNQTKDDLGMKEFLKYDHSRYLRGRSVEREKELPLYQVENQSYIHYGKGSVILYGLQEYIGEATVNKALANFLKEYAYAEPPYPTSLDFIGYLEKETPDSLKYLIEDWFKQITLYDLRINEASYKLNQDSSYTIKLNLENRKLYADTLGNETEIEMNDWVDIGLFEDREAEKPILIKRLKLESGKSEIKLNCKQKPVKAVVDPKRILIERVIDDNDQLISEAEV